jgi:hypothetical protein
MDSHHFGSKKLEPDPQQSEKQSRIRNRTRIRVKKFGAVELKMEQWGAVPVDAHNVGLEAQNGVVKVCRPVVAGSNYFDEEHIRIRIRIKVKSRIRIRIEIKR